MKELGIGGITISPGYAYERAPDQQHFLNRTKTKQLFRDILKRGRAAAPGRSSSRRFPRFPCRQSDLSVHAVGQPHAHRVRLAAALLSAWRRLREDLQGADGRYRLGQVRHRQLREVCRLHGAFGLRSDRRHGCRQEPWKIAAVTLKGVKTDGPMAPDIPARSPASCRVRVLAARREQASRDQRSRGPGQEACGSGINRPSRGASRLRSRIKSGSWPGSQLPTI